MYALINKYSSVEAVNQFFFIKTVWNKTFRTIESSKTEIAQKGNNDKKKDQHQDEQVKKKLKVYNFDDNNFVVHNDDVEFKSSCNDNSSNVVVKSVRAKRNRIMNDKTSDNNNNTEVDDEEDDDNHINDDCAEEHLDKPFHRREKIYNLNDNNIDVDEDDVDDNDVCSSNYSNNILVLTSEAIILCPESKMNSAGNIKTFFQTLQPPKFYIEDFLQKYFVHYFVPIRVISFKTFFEENQKCLESLVEDMFDIHVDNSVEKKMRSRSNLLLQRC